MDVIRILVFCGLFVPPYLSAMNFEWAVAECQGFRGSMEDRHDAIVPNNNTQGSFFAVYDGHGGHQVAEYLRQEFYAFFLSKLKTATSIQDALRMAFIEYDATLRRKPGNACRTGSTAVVVYLINHKAYIAWAGDSRAVVVRNNKVILSTQDHKPIQKVNAKEYERCNKLPNAVFQGRLYGQLAPSRAFGDFDLAPDPDNPGESHSKSEPETQALVVVPEILECDLQPGDVIVMACDGLWDVLSTKNQLESFLGHFSSQSDNEIEKKYTSKAEIDVSKNKPRWQDNTCTEKGNNHKMILLARALRASGITSQDNVTVSCIRIGGAATKSMSMLTTKSFLNKSNIGLAVALSGVVVGCYYLASLYNSDEAEDEVVDQVG